LTGTRGAAAVFFDVDPLGVGGAVIAAGACCCARTTT